MKLLDFSLLSAKAKQVISAFTVVETIVLTLWLDAIFGKDVLKFSLLPENAILAVVILFVGLLLEHLIAGVSGKV